MKQIKCPECKEEMKCLRCFQSKGGSATGPSKARDSAKMSKAAKVRWDKHRAKWIKHLKTTATLNGEVIELDEVDTERAECALVESVEI